jgi:hypothetical protein
MDAVAFPFNAADPMAWRDRLVNGSAPEAERVAAATREFEAVLLRQYLNEAMKPLTKGGPGMGGSNAVYGYLINDALATGLTRGGVFGFSSLLQAQVTRPTDVPHDDANTDL